MSVEEKVEQIPALKVCPEMTIRINSSQILQPSWRSKFPKATPLEMQVKHTFKDRVVDRILVEFYGGALIEFRNPYHRVQAVERIVKDIDSKMIHLNYEGETYNGISIE